MPRKITKNSDTQPDANRFQLNPSQLRALEMLLEGRSVTDTAKELDISRETVSHWRNQDPAFKAAYNDALKATWQASRNKLLDVRMRAIERLSELVESENETVAFKACMALMRIQIEEPRGQTNPESIAEDELLMETLKQRWKL